MPFSGATWRRCAVSPAGRPGTTTSTTTTAPGPIRTPGLRRPGSTPWSPASTPAAAPTGSQGGHAGVEIDVSDVLALVLLHTERAVLAVLGSDALLASDPSLQTSVALRNPYIDPLNILQAELLRRIRAEAPAPADVAVIEAFLVTVNGIAAGLRNTG